MLPPRIVIAAAVLLLVTGCGSPKNEALTITVSTDNDERMTGIPVVVEWGAVKARLSASRYVVLNTTPEGRDIPSQLDDLNGDGETDELFFLIDKPVGREIDVFVSPSEEQPTYEARTQAMLAIRQGGRFTDEGLYVDGSDFVPVERVQVPTQQEQDSDWAKFEGPVWESDLVGYRYYLDDRFRTDVFGKRVPEPVLHEVAGDYHAISDWGADILKVGNSLGLGSPAVATNDGLALIDNAESRIVDIVASGPVRSIVRTTMVAWNVLDTTVDVVSELEIHAGQRWTEQRLTFQGLPESARVATGIVRHPEAAELYSGETAGVLYMYTWGPQADQGDTMGMAVLVPVDQNPLLVDTDSATHVVTFDVTFDTDAGRAVYRYLAAWELEPDPIPNREAFEAAVREVAQRWSSSTNVTWK